MIARVSIDQDGMDDLVDGCPAKYPYSQYKAVCIFRRGEGIVLIYHTTGFKLTAGIDPYDEESILG